MLILGIESSCDDTSVALVDCSDKGCFVVKETAASQIDLHKKYGGVVPELAGRAHAEKIVPLIESVFATATPDKVTAKPDIIAVTAGPGLITGLIVGVEAARTLSWVWNIPLIAVNHIWGHIHSVEIKNKISKIKNSELLDRDSSSLRSLGMTIKYPALALIVSGGHTELILMSGPSDYQKIGATRDDAAGECFDKVAKLLDLQYPGGPKISQLAKTGKIDAIDFPRPMLKDDNFDFSFSGLKTAALYWLRDNKKYNINDFCASFEQAIVDVLVGKTLKAAQKYNPKTIILGGGVAANEKLRNTLAHSIGSKLRTPNLKYCMDNAAMIAVAGYYQAQKKEFADWRTIAADPNWEIE